MSNQPVIVWFRNDLRLTDHAALRAAAKLGPVMPVFVLDDDGTVTELQFHQPNGIFTATPKPAE